MNSTELALQVEQNDGQQPFAGGENQNNIQMTGSSQQLGVPKDVQTSSSAQQQDLMELLHAEAAGPTYSVATQDKHPFTTGSAIMLLMAFVLICVLLLVYYRFFLRRLTRRAAQHQVY